MFLHVHTNSGPSCSTQTNDAPVLNLLSPDAPSMQHSSGDVLLREQLVIVLCGANEMKERRAFDWTARVG